MEVTFTNVRIVVDADSPKAAYQRLTDILGQADVQEWESDEYGFVTDPESGLPVLADTEELFHG